MIEIKKPNSSNNNIGVIITEVYDLIALGTNFATLNTIPQKLILSNKSATNRIIPITASAKGFSTGVQNYGFRIAYLANLGTTYETLFAILDQGIFTNQSFNIVTALTDVSGNATNNVKYNQDFYINSLIANPLASFTQFELSISYFII